MNKYVSAGLKVAGGAAAAVGLWAGLGEHGLNVLDDSYLTRILPDTAFAIGAGACHAGYRRQQAKESGREYRWYNYATDFAIGAVAGAVASETWGTIIVDSASPAFVTQGKVVDSVGAAGLATGAGMAAEGISHILKK